MFLKSDGLNIMLKDHRSVGHSSDLGNFSTDLHQI